MAKKVPYVVFEGQNPGFYNIWIETEEQVKGIKGANFRGYTSAEGGRDAAERAYKEHKRSKQSKSVVPGEQEDAKQDAMTTSGKQED